MTRQIVITEKASQAKDVRAAVGSRYGAVLAAEGHLLDLCEPEDVKPGLEALVDGIAEAGRALRHQARHRRQQGGEAEGHPRGVEDGGAGVARHRLRPRGAADRSGNPGALPLPGRGSASAVHGAGRGDHPRGVHARPAERRARPALRGGGGAPAGGPDLQPLLDPDGDGDARPGRAGRGRDRAGQDADTGDRVPAGAGDPGLRGGGVFRGGGGRARRRRRVPDAARTEAAHRRARQGGGGRRGGAGLRWTA